MIAVVPSFGGIKNWIEVFNDALTFQCGALLHDTTYCVLKFCSIELLFVMASNTEHLSKLFIELHRVPRRTGKSNMTCEIISRDAI